MKRITIRDWTPFPEIFMTAFLTITLSIRDASTGLDWKSLEDTEQDESSGSPFCETYVPDEITGKHHHHHFFIFMTGDVVVS